MASSALKLPALHKLVVLLCAAAVSGATTAASGDVVTYSFPAFDANTTESFVVATNSSILAPASLLFDSPASPPLIPEFNRSEGFLLLSRTVDVWRAGADGFPDREASFNTSFTLAASGASPVAFVVLRDRYPPLNAPGGLRGGASYISYAGGPLPSNATGSLAAVEVGLVRSYGPDTPAVGLNVTVTPRGAAPGDRAVWIEYNATTHRLSVYVAGAGEPRPTDALVYVPLGVAGRWTTETAFVGFFAGTVRDVIVGVRDWDLTVDRFPADSDGNKGRSWWVILLAVLGSVVATAAVVTAVVWFVQSRRRRQLNVETKI